MSEKLLEIEDLYVKYRTDEAEVFAVNGLSLAIHKGETLGLVGETGAGKTTTALSILRLLPPKVGEITGGKIRLEGVDLTEASEAKMQLIRGNDISMIFQDPMTSLNPVIRIGDQIAETLKLHKKHAAREEIDGRVDEILNMVGISADRKHDFPHQFSGGMKQRVVIAIGLACEPRLLLADEPTTALDVTIQAQVLEMMRNLKDQLGTAMLLITHDLGVVAQTCDRVAIMYAGKVIEIGDARDIFEGEKHHPYTEGLFGSIPDMTKDTRRLSPIPGLMPDPTVEIEGCAFAERCRYCQDECARQAPPEICWGTHMIRCRRFAQEKKEASYGGA